jgi:hypothetical protein
MPAAGQFGQGQLEQVAEQLCSLGSLAERHFAAIGHSLEQAVGILAALTTTFQTLLDDLRGSALAQSGQDLAAVAARVGTLAGTAEADVATLHVLTGMAEAIDSRIARMHAVLREVDILSMNARLVAATMGEAGIGFLPFAAEIRRSAGTARDGLDLLAAELAGARAHLQAAGQAAGVFVGQHAATMQAITARLAASVASIEAHVRQSGDAAAVAGTRSDEIRGKVASAIVALQLGDITRQRIEHMHTACELLAQQPGPTPLGCRLVAAQLLDTAEHLERGTILIVDQLRELGTDAGDISRQGSQATGASDRRSGSFLDLLEADAHQAQTLFDHLRTAHATVNPRIAAVLQAANRLVAHVATIRSVEADIHIMGINTSLKCGRLGVVGRPLSVIAQAVRDCGRQTEQLAAGVLEALQQLLSGAGTLAAAAQSLGADAVDGVAQRMTGAVRRLGDTGQRMGAALAGLAGDGAAVARLLDTAVDGFAVRHEIGEVLRAAADACGAQAEQAAQTDGDHSAPVLARIAATYTMAREREVHAHVVPAPGGRAANAPARASTPGMAMAGAPIPAPADAEFADLLF